MPKIYPQKYPKNTKKVPKNYTKSVHKKCPQKVSTKGVHKKCIKSVHKKGVGGSEKEEGWGGGLTNERPGN